MTGTEAFGLSLGEIIRQQRELGELSMRQVAAMSGISTPYLSQIEHGLRAPSEQVLQGIAQSLQTSVDDLEAAAASQTPVDDGAVVKAARADPNLTARQRQALIEVYRAMSETTLNRRRRRRSSSAKSKTG